ncbi:hypothetical protein ACNO8X_18345 [Mycobacterium sp. PDNC021]|uniref:hypothetical protein n=1 Tax=Mycobacterium sp. PDNC021 TaxID=3391399 RepID=UPI003AAC04FE
MIAETLQVFRGDTDRFGNPHKEPSGTINGVIAPGKWALNRKQRGESSSHEATLFVARETDVKRRDRIIRPNGEKYNVVGGPDWDYPQPQTGRDHGRSVFTLELISA